MGGGGEARSTPGGSASQGGGGTGKACTQGQGHRPGWPVAGPGEEYRQGTQHLGSALATAVGKQCTGHQEASLDLLPSPFTCRAGKGIKKPREGDRHPTTWPNLTPPPNSLWSLFNFCLPTEPRGCLPTLLLSGRP